MYSRLYGNDSVCTSVFFTTVVHALLERRINFNIPCEAEKSWFSAIDELELESHTWNVRFYFDTTVTNEEEVDVDGIVTPEYIRQETREFKKKEN